MKRKSRVALFVMDLRGGGAERVMANLTRGLVDQGYEVDLLLFRARGPYLSEIPESVRVIDLKARHMLLSFPGFANYLRKEKPVAVLSALNQPNVIAIWAKRFTKSKARIVISIHNHLSVESKTGKSLNLKLMPLFVKRFYSWADAIVSVSHGVADDLAEMTGIPRDQISVIYNPVVSDKMLERSKQPVDHPWFAPGQPPVALAVGRLTAQKDFETLLHAFAKLRAETNIRLMILGQGHEREKLEALIETLGLKDDVSMPGFAENPFAYMSRAEMLVMSSIFEGLPTVMIEALACGTKIVSTDCPSGPSEILANGKYGELVPIGDSAALAKAMQATLNGGSARPPSESWTPYRIETVTAEYRKMLQLD